MSVENGGNSRDEEQRVRARQIIEGQFKKGRLEKDAYNDWTRGIAGDTGERWLEVLVPKEHYAERTRRVFSPEDAKLILQLSDPEAVAAYDKLVDEFNADLERIKQTKDQEACRKFWKTATDLIYSKKQ